MQGAKYKLYYFNIRGLAEPIRLLFKLLDIAFEDHRVEKSDWPTLKPTIPGGKLPLLEVTTSSGQTKKYIESTAIARMLARQHNLLGSTDEEYYKTERMMGEASDLQKEMFGIFHANSPEDKATARTKFLGETGPALLQTITNSLNESGGRFVAGDKVTIGDLYLMNTIDTLTKMDPNMIKDKFPVIHKHHESMLQANPKLSAYVKARLDTDV